jgi:hypothetical protein
MALSRILAAAGVSLLAVAGAAACDDFDEEMAVEAARNAAKIAQSPAAEGRSADAAAARARSEPTEIAAAEPRAATPAEPSPQ